MKAEEIRKNLIEGFNREFIQNTVSYGKPKMFETKSEKISKDSSFHISPVRGLGFRNEIDNQKGEKTYEIYNMQELIQSNPENMKTLVLEPQVIKAQMALVKRKEWQDILFGDVDWMKQIDLTNGWKRLFGWGNIH